MRPAFACVGASQEAAALPGLSRALGLEPPARFAGHDPHGRPRAESGGAPVPVSVGRCGPASAVALARGGRVGVDLVDPGARVSETGLLGLATPGERAWIQALPPAARRRKLLEVWACREALLKALGLGLALDPGAVELEPCGLEGLKPRRVLGSPAPPAGWHVRVEEGSGPADGLILGLAWTDLG